MKHKPGPARSGIGSNDLCADARHYTTFALGEIDRLMRDSEDEKLRFACAKYLLEQGWGRPALRRAEAPADDEIDEGLKERVYRMIDALGMQKRLSPPTG